MRPSGELRQALRSAFAERGPATRQSIVQALRLREATTQHHAHYTVLNMLAAGELRECGRERAANTERWRSVYELSPRRGDVARTEDRAMHDALGELERALCLWHSATATHRAMHPP